MGRDLADLRRKHVFGRLEIDARLNVHPECTAGLEELAEQKRVTILRQGNAGLRYR